jgi:uncharacterized protein (UPF0332 family)
VTEFAQLDEEVAQRVFQNTLDIWVRPEIQRRVAEGRLPENIELTAAQVIFNVGAPDVVRLNREVLVQGVFHAVPGVEAGDVVGRDRVAAIESAELTREDPDAAHVTILAKRKGWYVAFDLRFNAERVERSRSTAREYLDVAGDALKRGAWTPFLDNLWAAVELLAKAWLLPVGDEALLKSKKHTYVISKFNQQRKHGDVDPRFAALLSELQRMRNAARYEGSLGPLEPDLAREKLDTAEEMYRDVEARSPARTQVPLL